MHSAPSEHSGMPPATSRLARAVVAIAKADWPALAKAAAEARECGDDRARLDEALLQATLFFGFPRVVSAFEQVGAAWPRNDEAEGASIPHDQRATRGRDLFATIYGKNDGAVREKLRGFHPEFHDCVLEDAYGRILSRPGLDVTTRELLAVAALATLGQIPQLVAHARGALQFGASRDATRLAMRHGGLDDRRADEAMQRAIAGLAAR